MAKTIGNKTTAQPFDIMPWLWLAVGAIILPFTNFQTVIPITAWLAPIFIMRFTRALKRDIIALPVVVLVYTIAYVVAFRNDYVPGGTMIVVAVALFFGFIYSLGYIFDRILEPRLPKLLGTFVFPMAFTVVDFIVSLISPFASWASPAYSQYGELPLMQLVSVTGLYGLTFLIMWLAPAVNAAWEQGFSWSSVRRFVGPFAAVLLIVLLFGSVQIIFFPPASETVRVAAIAPDRDLNIKAREGLNIIELAKSTEVERAALKPHFDRNNDFLFNQTEKEVRAGAKIISWAEGTALVLKEDENVLIERAREMAKKEGIYLMIGPGVFLQTDKYPWAENRAVLIDPSGNILWDYHKTHLVPFGEQRILAPGSGDIPVVQSLYGKMSTVICYDADFNHYIRQTGQKDADILFAPSNDWDSVKQAHSNNAVFRAVENGVSLVRATNNGISIVTDYQGRELGKSDFFKDSPAVAVGYIPVRGTNTIYSIIGDLFAYVCIIGLLALVVLAYT